MNQQAKAGAYFFVLIRQGLRSLSEAAWVRLESSRDTEAALCTTNTLNDSDSSALPWLPLASRHPNTAQPLQPCSNVGQGLLLPPRSGEEEDEAEERLRLETRKRVRGKR
jgi:hypothetical protein